MQIAFMGVWPDAIGISGTVLVLASVVGIALEEQHMNNKSRDDGSEKEAESLLVRMKPHDKSQSEIE